MPKMKTHRGAAKRFGKTASGKIRRKRAYRRHILGSKTTKAKRQLRSGALVDKTDAKRIEKLVPHA